VLCGQDPVDAAIRTAASGKDAADTPHLVKFVPFDPATKMSEAAVTGPGGGTQCVVKGAFAVVIGLDLAKVPVFARLRIA
jgi:H+-transporting ATPase